MPIEVGIWRMNGTPTKIHFSPLEKETELEDVLKKDISVLDPSLMVIGWQIPTAYGKFIDLLALDSEGDLAIIELKKDKTPREVVAQVLDYASWVRGLTYDQVTAIYADKHPGKHFEEAFSERFGVDRPENMNENHSLVIVASELDPSTERIIDYLSTTFGVPINAVFFRHFTENGSKYLVRSWLKDPDQVEAQASKALSSQSGKEPWNGRDFYVAIGEDGSRSWEDCRKYGFVCAGGGRKWSGALDNLTPGARVFAYVPGKGYVGVGTIEETAVPARDFRVSVNGESTPILEAPLQAPSMGHDADDLELSEYAVRVKWEKTVPTDQAIRESGMFANPMVVCKLRSKFTLDRLTDGFGLDS